MTEKSLSEIGGQGYEHLLAAVKRDAEKGEGCFNPCGCDHPFYDHTDGCRRVSQCWHKFCDKIPWVLERAQHYAEKTGLDASAILDKWEQDRSYWYMNYYQDAKQPLLDADNIRVFDSQDSLVQSVGDLGFRCPRCGGVSDSPYECTSGQEMEPGQICDWKAWGLFGTLGKGAFVFLLDTMQSGHIFMPVAWEKADNA